MTLTMIALVDEVARYAVPPPAWHPGGQFADRQRLWFMEWLLEQEDGAPWRTTERLAADERAWQSQRKAFLNDRQNSFPGRPEGEHCS